MKNKPKTIVLTICVLLFILGVVLYLSAAWYIETYGNIGVDAMLYTLAASLDGISDKLVSLYLKSAVWPAAAILVLLLPLIFYPRRRRLVLQFFGKTVTLFPLHRALMCAVLMLGMIIAIYTAGNMIGLKAYLKATMTISDLYEQYYVAPDEVEIAFPEEKRNLVYIYMESMETTFFSQEQDGGLSENVIPELYELAAENINFSNNDSVGGYYVNSGGSWTIGALVSHSAGIPLKLPDYIEGNSYGNYEYFLPGATAISDILHENGYYQAFMCGSDANFAGRRNFFEQHGVDCIYDYYTAVKDGIVPEDHYVWWGMEDSYLYDYAKQELTKLAEAEKPFAFTMLTVDTHHVGGYVCPYCENTYPQQYKNVYACASRQLARFVEWLQQQDFYENTTIIITGDHCSMDAEFIQNNMLPNYERKVYNCIINSAVEPMNEKRRQASSIDMYPTTLAAMGCRIRGGRLALGTNMFSDLPTLTEWMGREELSIALMNKSEFYNNYILQLPDQENMT